MAFPSPSFFPAFRCLEIQHTGSESGSSSNGHHTLHTSCPPPARSPSTPCFKKKKKRKKKKKKNKKKKKKKRAIGSRAQENDLTLEIAPNLTGPAKWCLQRNKKAASGRDTSPFLLLSLPFLVTLLCSAYVLYPIPYPLSLIPYPIYLHTLVHSNTLPLASYHKRLVATLRPYLKSTRSPQNSLFR